MAPNVIPFQIPLICEAEVKCTMASAVPKTMSVPLIVNPIPFGKIRLAPGPTVNVTPLTTSTSADTWYVVPGISTVFCVIWPDNVVDSAGVPAEVVRLVPNLYSHRLLNPSPSRSAFASFTKGFNPATVVSNLSFMPSPSVSAL